MGPWAPILKRKSCFVETRPGALPAQRGRGLSPSEAWRPREDEVLSRSPPRPLASCPSLALCVGVRVAVGWQGAEIPGCCVPRGGRRELPGVPCGCTPSALGARGGGVKGSMEEVRRLQGLAAQVRRGDSSGLCRRLRLKRSSRGNRRPGYILVGGSLSGSPGEVPGGRVGKQETGREGLREKDAEEPRLVRSSPACWRLEILGQSGLWLWWDFGFHVLSLVCGTYSGLTCDLRFRAPEIDVPGEGCGLGSGRLR